MAQYALPISDSTNDGPYTEGAGDGDGSFFDELDEGFGAGRGTGSGPDDATTYWQSATSPTADRLTTTVSAVTDPNSSTGHIARSRNRKSASGGKQIDISTLMFRNATAFFTATFTNVDEVWTTREVTPSASFVDAITAAEYGALLCCTEANGVGGGAGRGAWVSAHEIEVPDAVTTPIPDRNLVIMQAVTRASHW